MSSSNLIIQRSTKFRNVIYSAKIRILLFSILRSTILSIFADFQEYVYQSLEKTDSLTKDTIFSIIESTQSEWICQICTHNLCDFERSLIVIDRSIHIISTVFADDQDKVCVIQSCQLICLFHKIRFLFDELIYLRFCYIKHIMRFLISNTDIIKSVNWKNNWMKMIFPSIERNLWLYIVLSIWISCFYKIYPPILGIPLKLYKI